MRIRIAKPADAKAIAQIYLEASSRMSSVFVARLGLGLLCLNYKLLLSEPNGIVLCLDDEKGGILGFVSGSSRIEEHFANLSSKRIRVGLACVGAFIRDPRLIAGAIRRHATMQKGGGPDRYVVSRGARLEFWACRKEASGTDAIQLLRAWLSLAKHCGCSEVFCEVDDENQRVLRVHQALNASVVERFKTADGRARNILKYVL